MAEAGVLDLAVELFSGVRRRPARRSRWGRATVDGEVRRRTEALVLAPVADTPEAFRALVETEIAQWRGVANAAGIKLER